MNQSHRIVQVINGLREQEIYVVLAGGAVRDTLRGNEPRDYDLWVMPHPVSGHTPTPEEVEGAMMLCEFAPFADYMATCAEEAEYDGFDSHRGEAPLRLYALLKYDYLMVDIIWVNGPDGQPVMDVQELLADFDLSINQEALVFDSEGGFVHVSLFDGERVLPVRKGVCPKRVAKLREKYPQYDYSAVEDV